jgi:hypothetical protein
MYRVEEVRDRGGAHITNLAHSTNPFDAFRLLVRVFWCGCEFIAFTTYNIFTDFNCIFPTVDRMHTLPYPEYTRPEE